MLVVTQGRKTRCETATRPLTNPGFGIVIPVTRVVVARVIYSRSSLRRKLLNLNL